MFKHRILIGILVVLGLVLAISVILLIRSASSKSSSIPSDTLQLANTGVTHNADWEPVIRDFGLGVDLALVPAGCFNMGATDSQLEAATISCEKFFGPNQCRLDFAKVEQPSHKVCFQKPFWLGATEVTNSQYGSNSSTDMIEMYRGPNWPRETVTWAEADVYCQQLGLRLPTEAEWEYAARGPDGLIYPWGDTFEAEDVIWGMLQPQDVGSGKRDVSWVGAWDLAGGVTEWVADWHGSYSDQDQVDPLGSQQGEQRVVRGGSWFSFAAFYARTTARYPTDPDYATSVLGFRCARDFE